MRKREVKHPNPAGVKGQGNPHRKTYRYTVMYAHACTHTHIHTKALTDTHPYIYTDLNRQKDTQHVLKDTDMNMNATQAKKKRKVETHWS